MKRRLIEKTVMATALAMFLGGTAIAGHNGAVARLEAAKSCYQAGVRMEALQTRNAPPARVEPGPASSWYTRVDAKDVNMAANRYEKRDHAAVQLEGKTYYVSDAAYAQNMRLNPSTRFAKDPLTEKLVDKAEAVIYADASGRAHYFESEKSFSDFIKLASTETVYGYSEAE